MSELAEKALTIKCPVAATNDGQHILITGRSRRGGIQHFERNAEGEFIRRSPFLLDSIWAGVSVCVWKNDIYAVVSRRVSMSRSEVRLVRGVRAGSRWQWSIVQSLEGLARRPPLLAAVTGEGSFAALPDHPSFAPTILEPADETPPLRYKKWMEATAESGEDSSEQSNRTTLGLSMGTIDDREYPGVILALALKPGPEPKYGLVVYRFGSGVTVYEPPTGFTIQLQDVVPAINPGGGGFEVLLVDSDKGKIQHINLTYKNVMGPKPIVEFRSEYSKQYGIPGEKYIGIASCRYKDKLQSVLMTEHNEWEVWEMDAEGNWSQILVDSSIEGQ